MTERKLSKEFLQDIESGLSSTRLLLSDTLSDTIPRLRSRMDSLENHVQLFHERTLLAINQALAQRKQLPLHKRIKIFFYGE